MKSLGSRSNRPRNQHPRKRGRTARGTNSRDSRSRIGVKTLFGLGLLCACLAGAWIYQKAAPLVTEWTTVRQITVIGLETLTKEEVLGVAAIPQESSLLSIDPDLLATRLEGHPWIASASVERVLPHTLAINLTERHIAAILRSKDGDHFLDDQGYVLPSRSEKTVPSLPILVGLDSQTLASQRETDRQRAQKGIQVATLLSEEFQSVPTLDVSHLNSIVAELPDVRFQFGPSFREQWQRFRMLHPSIRTDGEPLPQEIDLRYPGKVIFRRKG